MWSLSWRLVSASSSAWPAASRKPWQNPGRSVLRGFRRLPHKAQPVVPRAARLVGVYGHEVGGNPVGGTSTPGHVGLLPCSGAGPYFKLAENPAHMRQCRKHHSHEHHLGYVLTPPYSGCILMRISSLFSKPDYRM
jgi:hypothetical protein